jgi:hypothetical protein
MVGVAQLVEHLVVVQDVAGSSPVTHPKGVDIVGLPGDARTPQGVSPTQDRGTIVAEVP